MAGPAYAQPLQPAKYFSRAPLVTEQEAWLAEAQRLLPAWFTARMMTDSWSFGLLLDTGDTLWIERIDRVRQGANGMIWIDVTMLRNSPRDEGRYGGLFAPTSRLSASVNASKIVLALELADT
jgi:hypothetical protein